MAKSMQQDFVRRENRFLIWLDDFRAFQDAWFAKKIYAPGHPEHPDGHEEVLNPKALLDWTVHPLSITKTLYALTDYGLTPEKLKLRNRIFRGRHTGNRYETDSVSQSMEIGRVELKGGDAFLGRDIEDSPERQSSDLELFCDVPPDEVLESNPALNLVVQSNVFGSDVKLKYKWKAESGPEDKMNLDLIVRAHSGEEIAAKRLANFSMKEIEGMNIGQAALRFHEKYKGYGNLFMGIGTRYERMDCASSLDGVTQFRMTFDPNTQLYLADGVDLKALRNQEFFTRAEIKADPRTMDSEAKRAFQEAWADYRTRFLFPRSTPKSQQALTDGSYNQIQKLGIVSQFPATKLSLHVPLKSAQYSNFDDRKDLRQRLESLEGFEIAQNGFPYHQRFKNVAVAETGAKSEAGNKIILQLTDQYILTGPEADTYQVNDNSHLPEITLRVGLTPDKHPIESGEDLTSKVNEFESFGKFYAKNLQSFGYVVKSEKTGRHYLVSYRASSKGNFKDGRPQIEKQPDQLVIQAVGISKSRIYDGEPQDLVESLKASGLKLPKPLKKNEDSVHYRGAIEEMRRIAMQIYH